MPKGYRFTPEQVEQGYQVLRVATRSSPVTSEDIGRKLRLEDVEGNLVSRSLIYEVIRQKRLPLISLGNRGYFVATTEEEVKEYIDRLQKRSLGNMQRAALLAMVFREKHPEADVGHQASPEDEW